MNKPDRPCAWFVAKSDNLESNQRLNCGKSRAAQGLLQDEEEIQVLLHTMLELWYPSAPGFSSGCVHKQH